MALGHRLRRLRADGSPADRLGTKALVGSKKSRERVLDDDELRALWQALGREHTRGSRFTTC